MQTTTTRGCRVKSYKIQKTVYDKTGYSMVISDRGTGKCIAEYRLTPGQEASEINQMRRQIDAHLSTPGGTLGNYQW
jgi:hypothetical protein